MQKKKSFSLLCLFSLLLLTPLLAEAALRVRGPKSPEHGFPKFYSDTNGLRLQLCVAVDPNCLELEDVDVNQPIIFPTNFPGEAFWWTAEREIPINGGGSVLLVLALEAAFGNEVPEEGQRVSFARERIRGFNLDPGTYTITHPYGTRTFRVTGRARRNINFTSDVGLVPEKFNGALKGKIGPFLKWDPAVAPKAPAGYVGNPNVLHRVTGSPRGTNFLRVRRNGVQVGFSREFNVSGKIQPPTVPFREEKTSTEDEENF